MEGKHIENFSTFTERLRQQRAIKEEAERSNKQNEYANFFKKLLQKYNVTSPAELSDDKKSKFFDEVSNGWKEGEGLTADGKQVMNEDSEKIKVNEEMYDLIGDLIRILGRNNSQSRVEGYLGRSLSSYEVRELKRARVIR